MAQNRARLADQGFKLQRYRLALRLDPLTCGRLQSVQQPVAAELLDPSGEWHGDDSNALRSFEDVVAASMRPISVMRSWRRPQTTPANA